MLKFYKMQANGNDFVILPLWVEVNPDIDIICQICDRRLGIGCDQLLIICPPLNEEQVFFCRIFNSDGTEAFQCGNGARCIALYAFEKLCPNETSLVFQMGKVVVEATMVSNQVKIGMGVPVFFQKEDETSIYEYPSAVERWWPVIRVFLGNSHAIVFNQNLSYDLVGCVAPHLMKAIDPVDGVNISFCDVISSSDIRLLTFERGAGLTNGCGSASCAAVAAGIRAGFLSRRINVRLLVGELLVEWIDSQKEIFLIGRAYYSFVGDFPANWVEILTRSA
ncbi:MULTISPECIES: diaminopimelate epimerase [Candidatus Ichthyocystis]|uniref:Diaminopimelate epimerase n=1 Tax=Candidatus Ichthyocystis hellenicum TaxID=1561003 RepID=A0A0S4M0U0_9BURK|nr:MULTISPECIES: diaminopimelate epimerase [Ichthyocystis]CUT17233.1 Diaminopimelate epimerase [Candidatus Ichthyocystis hellenicum]